MPKGAGGREDHLRGAPTGLLLPGFRAAKQLHLVAVGGRGGGVTEIRYRHRRGGGKVESSGGIAHWRSRGRVEGRRAAVGWPTAAAKEGRGERGRGRGRGRGEGGPPVRGTVGAPAPLVL